MLIFFFHFSFIIHMCIQGLVHFSPLPPPPPIKMLIFLKVFVYSWYFFFYLNSLIYNLKHNLGFIKQKNVIFFLYFFVLGVGAKIKL
jgi:hypothetical protein